MLILPTAMIIKNPLLIAKNPHGRSICKMSEKLVVIFVGNQSRTKGRE
jgi:hypothetical protein